MDLQQIFNDTDFVHTSGTKEELQVAGYLKMQCENIGGSGTDRRFSRGNGRY